MTRFFYPFFFTILFLCLQLRGTGCAPPKRRAITPNDSRVVRSTVSRDCTVALASSRCSQMTIPSFERIGHFRTFLREESATRYGPRQPRPTKLDDFKSYLQQRIEAARPRWIPAVVLWREIRELGYRGGVTQLKAFIRPFKQVKDVPVVRFETAPGEQMQADFTVSGAGVIRCWRLSLRWVTAAQPECGLRRLRTLKRCARACARR